MYQHIQVPSQGEKITAFYKVIVYFKNIFFEIKTIFFISIYRLSQYSYNWLIFNILMFI
jgi:hypothetical protein